MLWLTAVKVKLEVDQIHVHQLLVNRLVRYLHPHMFDFDEVPLQGALELVVELEERRDLKVISPPNTLYNLPRGSYLREFFPSKGAHDHVGSLQSGGRQ